MLQNPVPPKRIPVEACWKPTAGFSGAAGNEEPGTQLGEIPGKDGLAAIRKPSWARGTAEPGKGFPRKGSRGPGLGWSRSQGEPWAGDRPRCPPAATIERGLAVTPWNGTFLLIPPLSQPGRSASHQEREQGCGTGSPWPCLGWQQQLEAVQSLQKAFLWAGTGAVPVTHHGLAAEPQPGIPE